nr:integrase core domain-containing protein [Bordetella pertussis]
MQSALREWAYAHTYQNSQHRADAMKSWLHHYNWHRPHQGIGRAVPISRLNLDEYNLLTVHTSRVRGNIRRNSTVGGCTLIGVLAACEKRYRA